MYEKSCVKILPKFLLVCWPHFDFGLNYSFKQQRTCQIMLHLPLTLSKNTEVCRIKDLLILSEPGDLQWRSSSDPALQDHQLPLHSAHIMETLSRHNHVRAHSMVMNCQITTWYWSSELQVYIIVYYLNICWRNSSISWTLICVLNLKRDKNTNQQSVFRLEVRLFIKKKKCLYFLLLSLLPPVENQHAW